MTPDTFVVSKNIIIQKMEHTHMETKMIGSKIAKARKKISISQAQLAKRLFISPQAVGKCNTQERVNRSTFLCDKQILPGR